MEDYLTSGGFGEREICPGKGDLVIRTFLARYSGFKGWTVFVLLALAEKNQFDVFLSGDRNLVLQQSTIQFRIVVVVLEAPGVQLHRTLPLMPKVLALLSSLQPG